MVCLLDFLHFKNNLAIGFSQKFQKRNRCMAWPVSSWPLTIVGLDVLIRKICDIPKRSVVLKLEKTS